jgi:hypothetical protein
MISLFDIVSSMQDYIVWHICFCLDYSLDVTGVTAPAAQTRVPGCVRCSSPS